MTLDPPFPHFDAAPLGCIEPELGSTIVNDLRRAIFDPDLIRHRADCLACDLRVREFLQFRRQRCRATERRRNDD